MSGLTRSISRFISHNQGRLALAVLLFACIYFIVVFGEQAWRANRLEAEIAQQQASIADIRRENAQLAARAELMNSPAYTTYVEQIARRDLSLARPGETTVIVPRRPSSPAAGVEPTPGPDTGRLNWQLWIDAVFDRDDP